MGNGVLAVWSDVAAEGEADYTAWYEREHMFERLQVPGFRRARHYLTVSGRPKYFTYFEMDSAGVAASPAYLAQANSSSPWTRRVLPHFRNTNRTAATVLSRRGRGYGAAALTLRFTARAGRAAELAGWLGDTLVPELATRPGIMAAALWQGDGEASLIQVGDRALRPEPDRIADLVLFVDATGIEPLAALAETALARAELAAHGAADGAELALHRLLNGAEADPPPL